MKKKKGGMRIEEVQREDASQGTRRGLTDGKANNTPQRQGKREP